ncbi:hypothetical protein OG474_38875 [Kribbella sp. NBC_01505]|uniref:hypothetical protein n=1 Tax=Kribbella sp. NBC_01505 TaxID=2903580 RepID=UPI0038678A00
MTLATIDLVAMADLIRRMTDAAGALEATGRRIKSTSSGILASAQEAAVITQTADWATQQLPGLRRRLSLAQQIENQSINLGRHYQGNRGSVRIDESLLSTLTPDQARALGKDIATKINADPGHLSPELVAVLAKNQSDPYFALGFAGTTDLKQLSWALRFASRERESILTEHGKKSPELAAWTRQYTTLVSALGTTLATATRDVEGVGLPAGFAEKYADAITEGKSQSSTPSEVMYGQGQSLSMLLRYGRFSTRFLDTVSSKVYDYEYAHKDNPVWAPRSFWEPNRVFAGAYQPDGRIMPDVMANVLESLSRNPEAAQNFFDVSNPHAATTDIEVNGQKVAVNSRLKYLIQDRAWPDFPDKYPDLPGTWPGDAGDALGNALQSATTTWRDRTPEGRTSATIASQTFALIGDHIGQGKVVGSYKGYNDHQGWKPGTAMRDSLARMLASYSPDLIRVAGLGNGVKDKQSAGWLAEAPTGFPPGGPFGAAVSPAALGHIIGILAEDPNHLKVVAAGVGAAGQLMYSYAFAKDLKGDPHVPVDMINGVGKSPAVFGVATQLSSTMGFLIMNGIKGKKSDEDFDKVRAQNVSNAIGLALKLPFIPMPTGKWTGLILDQVTDASLAAIANAPSNQPTADYESEKSAILENLKELAVSNMLRAGYFDQKYYDLANGPRPGRRLPPPSNAFVLGPDGKPVSPPAFDFASAGFHDWYTRSGMGPSDWVQNSVVDPYGTVLTLLSAHGGAQ